MDAELLKLYAPPASPTPIPPGRGKSRIDVGIEIGTSKVCVAVGERKKGGPLSIMGVGVAPSRGVSQGIVTDIDSVVQCVRQALEIAEDKSEVVIKKIRLAITGESMVSFNHRSGIDIPASPYRITEKDCRLAREEAGNASVPPQNVMLHQLLQRYSIDGQAGLLNPVGQSGRRLEASFHTVHGVKAQIQNSIRCISQLGLDVDDVIFSPLAAAVALLHETHQNQGALLIDIGAGTTGYILYVDGVARQSGVLARGGNQITQSIATSCHISLAEAERIKIQEGNVLPGYQPGGNIVVAASTGFPSTEIERNHLNGIIRSGLQETLEMLHTKIKEEPNLWALGAGIFLTGGTSLLNGVGQFAEDIFNLPAHPIHEQPADGPAAAFQNPQYSTALGLLCWE